LIYPPPYGIWGAPPLRALVTPLPGGGIKDGIGGVDVLRKFSRNF